MAIGHKTTAEQLIRVTLRAVHGVADVAIEVDMRADAYRIDLLDVHGRHYTVRAPDLRRIARRPFALADLRGAWHREVEPTLDVLEQRVTGRYWNCLIL